MGDTSYIVLRRANTIMSRSSRFSTSTAQSALRDPELEFTSSTEVLGEKEAEELKRDPNVLGSSPLISVELIQPVASATTSAPVDEVAAAKAAGASWGVKLLAPNATSNAGESITVAVLDTGIDHDHPAFQGLTLTRKNFSSSSNDADVHGHGTHCAATIFGRDVEGVRIGIARGVRRALIGKVLNDAGRGDSASIVNAIVWAQQQGAKVISISIAINFGDMVLRLINEGKPLAEATSRALASYRDTVRVFDTLGQLMSVQGVLTQSSAILVAAAGNDSARQDTPSYVVDVSLPAAATGMISVGAIKRSFAGNQIANFSNINPMLCAPGVDIVSAKVGGGLIAMNGTSMAAPHASGLAVLWWEQVLQDNPAASAELVRSKILAGCCPKSFAVGVKPPDRGAGLISAP